MRTTNMKNVLLVLALCNAGCFAVADLDRFEFDEGRTGAPCDPATNTDASEIRDLIFSMRDVPHVGKHTEIRVVSQASSNPLEAIYVYQGLPARDVVVRMPGAIRRGPFRLDFWADVSGDESLDAPPDDHTWSSITPDTLSTDQLSAGCAQFDHNTVFSLLNDPEMFPVTMHSDLQVRALNFQGFQSRAVEMRVIINQSGVRTIGVYRFQELPNENDTLFVFPGIGVAGDEYTIEMYVDLNANLMWDRGEEPSWRSDATTFEGGRPIMFEQPDLQTPLTNP